jgi:hypothetical protein
MARWRNDIPQFGEPFRTARFELLHQVLPLERELTRGDRDGLYRPNWPDPGFVERVAARDSLGMNRSEICIDRSPGVRVHPESLELRMMDVSARFAAQYGPGEQRLAPQGDKPLRIKVPWMQ